MANDEEPTGSDLMTVAEVARELRLTAATVRLRIREGKLPAIRVGERGYRVRRSDLRRMMAFPNAPDRPNAEEPQRARAGLSTSVVDHERNLRPASRAEPPTKSTTRG